jgi:hypothetical protein
MLIGMYEHLEQAHSAIRELQQNFGLSGREIGCAFAPSDIRVPSLFRRALNRIMGTDSSTTTLCNAELLSRMVLPSTLRTRALQLLRSGGALVSVEPRPEVREPELFRVLNTCGAAEVLVVQPVRTAPLPAPLPRIAPEAAEVKVVGALENLVEQPAGSAGKSAVL